MIASVAFAESPAPSSACRGLPARHQHEGFLSDDEVVRLGQAAETSPDPRAAVLLHFAYEMYVHTEAVLALCWKDVVTSDGAVLDVINVRGRECRARVVAMAPNTKRALLRWYRAHKTAPQPEWPLFKSRKVKSAPTPLNRSALWRICQKLGTDAQIQESLNPQILRRTGALHFYLRNHRDPTLLAQFMDVRSAAVATAILFEGVGRTELPPLELASPEDKQIVGLYADEVTQLRSQLADSEGRLLAEMTAHEETQDELRLARHRIEVLTQQLAQRASAPAPAVILPMASLADVTARVQSQFADKITLTPSAIRSMEESPYVDAARAWSVFELLAGAFFTHYSGGEWATVQDAITRSGIMFQHKSSDATVATCPGYTRIHRGQRITLKRHLGIGGGRDPRRCFRLYFEWVPEEGRIVVFHAGRHLDTIST